MEEVQPANPPVSSPPTSTIQPIVPQNSSNPLHWVIIILLVLVLGLGAFIAWQLWKQTSGSQQVSDQVSQVDKQVNTQGKEEATSSSQLKKIAYVKDKSIYLINQDGSDKKIFKQAQTQISYANPFWKDINHLSYLKCVEECLITTSRLDATSEVQEIKPGEYEGYTQIMATAWNHAGNQLAYIYKLPDGQMKMDFKSGSVKNVVKNFASGLGRGGSLDDSVSIYFSPDDKYVLVTNTTAQPNNADDKNTIWVFEAGGKEILNIESKENSWATHARWLDDQDLIYKQGKSLKRFNLQSKKIIEIFNLSNFYNPIPLYNYPVALADTTYYWAQDGSTLPYLGYFDNNEKEKGPQKFLEGYYKPELNGISALIAIKVEKNPPGGESFINFKEVGIAKIKTVSKEITDLDSGDINLFAISP